MTINQSAALGRQGELLAQKIYRQRGFSIIAKNYFNRRGKRFGEIDFIALKNGQLRFVEVKSRASAMFGDASEAITRYKKSRLTAAAQIFLLRLPEFSRASMHFDVVTIGFGLFDKAGIKVKIYSDAIDGIY